MPLEMYVERECICVCVCCAIGMHAIHVVSVGCFIKALFAESIWKVIE